MPIRKLCFLLLLGVLLTAGCAAGEPRVLAANLRVPPTLGERYAAQFRAIYPALAEKNDVALVPLLLKGVAGAERLTQPDGTHPTVGRCIVAENVWAVLGPVLRDLQKEAVAS